MPKLLAILMLMTLAGCSDSSSWPKFERARYPGPKACAAPVENPKTVSLVKLLARPELYEGRAVRVIGFYRKDFEHSAIYLHKDDAEFSIMSNGLWVLGTGLSSVGNRYVQIEGIFTASSRGHLDQWPATICGVVSAVALVRR